MIISGTRYIHVYLSVYACDCTLFLFSFPRVQHLRVLFSAHFGWGESMGHSSANHRIRGNVNLISWVCSPSLSLAVTHSFLFPFQFTRFFIFHPLQPFFKSTHLHLATRLTSKERSTQSTLRPFPPHSPLSRSPSSQRAHHVQDHPTVVGKDQALCYIPTDGRLIKTDGHVW